MSESAFPTNVASTSRPWDECSEVTFFCPLEATVLGYYPNLGANIFFTIVFGINMIASVYFAIRYKTWSYSLALVVGCMLETAGYVGRIFLHFNAWNQDAFQLQICAIVLAPTVICISIYLTLKHVCLSLNPALSRVRPSLYPFIFVPGDAMCLLVQAIGGALAASGGYDNPGLTEAGNRAIIAGIVLQVVVLGAFGVLLIDYFVHVKKYYRDTPPDQLDPERLKHWEDRKFWIFVKVMSVAYTVIFIRCIYRIAEMAGGWGNHIMQDEVSFIVLDSCAVTITVSLLTFFPPGILFPSMAARMNMRFHKASSSSDAQGGSRAGKEEEAPETTLGTSAAARPAIVVDDDSKQEV